MTTRVIPIQRGSGRGRQPAEVEALRDLRDELTALVLEDLDHARQLLALARTAMRQVAKSQSPSTTLVELETLILRLTYQRKSAESALRADEACPDGLVGAPHGVAA